MLSEKGCVERFNFAYTLAGNEALDICRSDALEAGYTL